MSSRGKSNPDRKTGSGILAFLWTEFSLFIGLGTAAVFWATGDQLIENLKPPFGLAGVLLWLFVAVLWSAFSVARHADFLAIKCGEPYGTLILTLSAISIEVVMISAAVLHGKNNPTFARDMMVAVIMIALNGLVGLCLLLGGLRHHEQQYNLQGATAYLNAIMTLAVIGLILPDFTLSEAGPRLSISQEIFLVVTSLALYGIFLFIQTMRHSQHFTDTSASDDPEHHSSQIGSAAYHAIMLFLYLIAVILLAEKFAIPLDSCVEEFGMPQALAGAIVAGLVLAPEALAAIQSTLKNQLQRSVNILHGSVLASIGLTIPAILTIGIITDRPVLLGVQGGYFPLLVLTLGVSVVTFASGKTNILQGCIHLLLFAVFILLIFSP